MAEKKKKAHVVLARKYRPQVFADVVAQQHVTQAITNALRTGRVAQAYLFVGPRGVGKTTLARIYAKALNCEKGPTPEPCNQCSFCTDISEGRCLDVLEFDAASNTQVDRIREIIIESIDFAPAHARFKVFVIDEVHMLSQSSFNALLKTLEEPPAHVRFVFATTEPQKIPATILSRCQRFDLRRIPTAAIVEQLEKIARLEKVDLRGDAALAIARGAEGGLRDAESALDQLMAFCGATITEADVLSVFGLVSWRTLQTMATAILSGDVPTVLRQIGELDGAGKDLLRLTLEMLDYFRDLMLVSYTGSMGRDESNDPARLAILKEQAALADAARISHVTDVLVDLQSRMKDALSRRTTLEVALVRAARSVKAVSLDEVLAALAEAPGPVSALESPAPAAPQFMPARPPPAPAGRAAPPSAVTPPPVGDELALLRSEWSALAEKAGALNPIVRSCLKDAEPEAVTAEHVRIAFDPEFSESREKLNIPRNIRMLQKLIEDVLRRPLSIELVVRTVSSPGAAPGEPAPVSDGQAPKRVGSREWRKEDAVRRAMDAFNGDVVDVRE